MAGNSLKDLLAWMKGNSRMLGWGLVVAMERRKTNLLLLQEYISRFDTGSYLPPIRGEVPIVENQWLEFVHDFVMDVPVLSFENADLNDSKAMLTMAVMGGSQITLKKESVGWKAVKVDEIDPLQGPKLYLDLLLNEVPGDVDVDGRVILDLSKSDNFRLTFGQTQHEQRMGGDFFKDLFNQLPDEKRIYPLGKIERGTQELMHPQSFALRTQASGAAARDPESPEYGDGAVLALVRMEGRAGGNIPGANYKYLIPDDQGKDYSATVLFDSGQTMKAALLNEVEAFIQSHEFDYTYDQNDELIAVSSTSGVVVVPEYDGTTSETLPDGSVIDIGLKIGEVSFPAGTSYPLNVEFTTDKASVHWTSSAVAECVSTTKDKEPFLFLVPYKIVLETEYEFVETDEGMFWRQTKFDFRPYIDIVPSENFVSGKALSFWMTIIVVLMAMLFTALTKVFIDNCKRYFTEDILPGASVTESINEIIKLNFGQAIQGNEIYAPHDIGFFGRINPTQTSFVVSPMQPLIKQGGTLQFTTDPVVTGVQWKVENLVEGPGNPGTINNSGMYQAPAAASISGRFTRVRVTATAPDRGYHSSALVTVVVSELSVHPLIQICDIGATVELAAGLLGEGTLSWSIKNPVSGESGEVRRSDKPDGDHTYHHGPVVSTKTYVIDEIEVKKTGTNETRSVHVLALQKAPGLTVEILSTDVAQGRVQLQAIVNGNAMAAEWSLPLGGPGSIDQTGRYQSAATATERFALIFAVVDGGAFGTFEGHLILPLPLVELPQLLEKLSE